MLQPFAEVLSGAEAARGDRPGGDETPGGRRCPWCGGQPVAATLRERGHGAARSLVCGLCHTEWPALRMVCPVCGETRVDTLPVFRAAEFPHVRLDACDQCRTYIKTIDLTITATAIPIVDDLASLALDLWAGEQGYHKIRPNLLRL